MIKIVTITGADDSIQPEELFELSQEYPFVEWGLLYSKQLEGKATPRFPSFLWLTKYGILCEKRTGLSVNTSLHMCGRAVKETFKGFGPAKELVKSYPFFGRIQLNTHGEYHPFTMDYVQHLPSDIEYIFQYDNVNFHQLNHALDEGLNCSALFDLSHGECVLPDKWPELLPNVKCGFAGGLGPDNLEEQIGLIEERAGTQDIWIDMETHVRTKEKFDLVKVRHCLEIAQKHIESRLLLK